MTQELLKELWRRFGTSKHPAEWDGAVYGGGKLSQRFWEYFIAIKMLGLSSDSRLIDIGGGSNKTGTCFFADLCADSGIDTTVCDPNAKRSSAVVEPSAFNPATLFQLGREFTHISCLSVLEHVDRVGQRSMIETIDAMETVQTVVFTFEYHPRTRYFEQQLTTRSAGEAFSAFKNFYLTEFEISPTRCTNAYRGGVPAWIPAALKFCRI